MKLYKAVLPLVLAAASLLSYGAIKHRFKLPTIHAVVVVAPPKPVTDAQRATHRITMVDSDGSSKGRCTATAIGPHALLTATHCNEGPEAVTVLNVDLSRRKYNITAQSEDGEDHLILIVDGPEFTNLIKIDADAKDVKEGEAIHLYGCGRGMYPCRELDGKLETRVHDYSDVSKHDGLLYFTMQIVPGDSGSAVLNASGRVIAVTTYHYAFPMDGNPDNTDPKNYLEATADFKLAFTAQQIKNAEHGVGDKKIEKQKPIEHHIVNPFMLFPQHI